VRQDTDLLNLALAAALAAGREIVAARSGSVVPEQKGHGDWVSAVDRGAEAAAVAILRAATPEIGVLAEESGGERGDRFWVIDPLDGTTNFLRGYPAVGVSVALMEERTPRVGVITAPFLGERWTAIRGQGAYDGRGRRLDISGGAAGGVTATGFPFRRPDVRARYLRTFGAALDSFEDLRRAGAASLDLSYSAQGTWSGFFELGLALWDIAAGALLVREAGGVATDWTGDPHGLFDSGDILAGAPAWHERMLELAKA
jgi:myo-inositol-1(or 4)-monophosphatase